MEQQSNYSEQASTPKDRKIKIKCTPTLIWYNSDPNNRSIGATMEFEQVDGVGITDPPMPGVIGPHGKIDISKMPPDDKYTDNIDITFQLDDSKMKDADGSKLTGKARWALPGEGQYTAPDGTKVPLDYGWFCRANSNAASGYDPFPPIAIPGMTFSRKNDNMIEIDDNTADGSPEYGYCIAFVLEGYGNYYISYDPLITSKGRGINK